ncbi:MAG TPA: YdeI/OmpD-associated family protein [Chitinophagaceae bacterium]|nr:YdeI/OmpD-associated family protein [Chitinophagaceae bacterium]
MPAEDSRIDSYIAKSKAFAKPVLTHIRKLIHKACPQVQENIKWGMPYFEYKGNLCWMAAFNEHCALGFWRAALLKNDKGILQTGERDAMGHLGRIASLKDLPGDKILMAVIQEAAAINEMNIKPPAKKKTPATKEIEIPAVLTTALQKNKTAQKVFNAFSNSTKKEYADWIAQAKTQATQQKRLQTAIEWMAEGKTRNWKYERK